MKQRFIYLFILIALASCGKQNEWLDAKRKLQDVEPKSLKDFQAILDNSTMFTNYPTIGLNGTDNYYYPNESINYISTVEKNAYFWNKDIFEGQISYDYYSSYLIIGNANIVLEGLGKVESTTATASEYNSIMGQALFFRSFMFYELANAFCKPFDKITAATDLGICIRTKSDVNYIEPRSTVAQTYDRIIRDLKQAALLLPITPMYKTRPSKPAAFALLSKTYLQMNDFIDAKKYVDSAFAYSSSLIDFNSSAISSSRPYRFPDFSTGNPEIIFYATGLASTAFTPNEMSNMAYVDTSLYSSYDKNDLRNQYFYSADVTGYAKFRGTYTGTDRIFSGLATNELYFIRSECNARLSNAAAAIDDLNKILVNRFVTGTYRNFITNDPYTALVKILEERRKEFPFTGQIRWADLRRLNKEPAFAKMLTRLYKNVIYPLRPNDPKYVYPFPQSEIDLAGLKQNER